MAGGLLSLKWNHHKATFLHVLSTVRAKDKYCDVTLACDGKFYPVHKLVLSTCSEYFEEMFERAQCKHPVIVLKDTRSDDLEALLNYMYVGEVNVLQDKLSGLIKAAEGLRIKGLAVADEEPTTRELSHSNKRRRSDSPQPKRRKREDSYREDDPPTPHPVDDDYQSPIRTPVNSILPEPSPDGGAHSNASDDVAIEEEQPDPAQTHEVINEILLEEAGVKEEPPDEYPETPSEQKDSKEFFHDHMEDYDHNDPSQDSHVHKGPLSPATHNPSTSNSGGWEDGVSGPSNSESTPGIDWVDDSTFFSGITHSDYDRFPGRWAPRGRMRQIGKPNGNKFTCSVCPYSCSVKRDMQLHFRTHTGEKPFICPYCSYKCAVKLNLNKHVRRKHSSDKPFHCTMCPYTAPVRENLKQHMMCKHGLSDNIDPQHQQHLQK